MGERGDSWTLTQPFETLALRVLRGDSKHLLPSRPCPVRPPERHPYSDSNQHTQGVRMADQGQTRDLDVLLAWAGKAALQASFPSFASRPPLSCFWLC